MEKTNEKKTKEESVEALVNEALECKRSVTVGQAATVFMETMTRLFTDGDEKNNPFIRAGVELGMKVLKGMFYSLAGSCIGSLYASAVAADEGIEAAKAMAESFNPDRVDKSEFEGGNDGGEDKAHQA